MLDFIDVRIVAVVQVLVALGILRFWFTWLRTEHEEPWLPPGYVLHERCFVYPDSLLATLLIVSAVLHFLGRPVAGRISLVCGGMMLFLVVIDTAYFFQNGMFAKEKGGAENVGILVPLALVCLLLILRFL